ncbi:ABC transporter substrate-binding protein [Halorubrum sp. AD140]|uniref:ABC transporter substrate-binding protein n=1 Tax=Halorubrum sp. AD140 TaxID=3050073 RepID=UPI002ACCAF5D|nr:ABC transporter substrate-binding protein [Halorubrum sp. AD140]MDZ5812816.1 ABC transporter substrate-binding protein [Halorubrum sp. AD140]
MSDDNETIRQGAPTRRDYVKYGGAVVGGGLLAGCTGDSGGDGSETDNSTANESSTDESDEPEDTSYSVTMAPAGEVTFDSVPERWVPYSAGYADAGIALGQSDGMVGIGQTAEYYTHFYEELPGVSVDRESLTELVPNEMSKELFYELDSDVHFIDTEMLKAWFDWDQADVDEIRENVAPFLGNLGYRRSDDWHDYRYYTLYETFEKLAEAFDERDRYEAFEAFHDEFIADVQTRLPPADERPNVLLTFELNDEPEAFSPYRLNDKGTNKKQWRDLGVSDALAGTDIENLSTTERTKLDYEGLLDVNPDVLLIRGHERKSPAEFRETVLAYMRDHSVGSELTAVQNERVYRGGPLKQGPIQNLFLTERGAKQLYPDVFGEVTGDEQLFDRQRVADIINGDI